MLLYPASGTISGFYYYYCVSARGLCCCTPAFSSFGEPGLLARCCVGLLTVVVSPVVEHRLCGTAAAVVAVDGPGCPAACGIFLDQGLKPCPCFGRQILNHWTTREVLLQVLVGRSRLHVPAQFYHTNTLGVLGIYSVPSKVYFLLCFSWQIFGETEGKAWWIWLTEVAVRIPVSLTIIQYKLTTNSFITNIIVITG